MNAAELRIKNKITKRMIEFGKKSSNFLSGNCRSPEMFSVNFLGSLSFPGAIEITQEDVDGLETEKHKLSEILAKKGYNLDGIQVQTPDYLLFKTSVIPG